jgi:hypothetical protein
MLVPSLLSQGDCKLLVSVWCAGSWAEDKMDGQGTYHYSSGDIYTGGFRQGRKHGSGMYNFKAHACQFLGIWSDGEFVEGKWVSAAFTFARNFGSLLQRTLACWSVVWLACTAAVRSVDARVACSLALPAGKASWPPCARC